MSAHANDSLDYQSREDSIPIESRSVSGSDGGYDDYDYEYDSGYDYDDSGYDYDDDNDGSSRSGSQGVASEAQQQQRQRQPESRGSAATGVTENSQASYMYNSSYDYGEGNDFETGYEYESGYNSGYLDGSLSYTYSDTPRSRSPSFMNSTFNSLYYDNPVMRFVRKFTSFYWRPLVFLGFSTVGSGAVAKVLQLMHALYRPLHEPLSRAGAGAAVAFQHSAPKWLRELRASLPSVVEVPVTWWLHRRGIPIMSETQRKMEEAAAAAAAAQNTAARAGAQQLEEIVCSKPMLPVAVLLPIFTIITVRVAKNLISKQVHPETLYDGAPAAFPGGGGGGGANINSPIRVGKGSAYDASNGPSRILDDSNAQDDSHAYDEDDEDDNAPLRDLQNDSVELLESGQPPYPAQERQDDDDGEEEDYEEEEDDEEVGQGGSHTNDEPDGSIALDATESTEQSENRDSAASANRLSSNAASNSNRGSAIPA